MIYRMLARMSIRHAKTILCAWLIFLIAFGWFAVRLPSALKDHGLRTEGSYAQVQRILATQFHMPDEPVVLLFEKQHQVSQADFHHFIEVTLQRVHTVNGLKEIISPLATEGLETSDAAYALLSFRQQPNQMKPVLNGLSQQLLPRNPQMTVTMTGKPVVQEEVNRTSRSDLKKAEMIGIPAAFLILWLSFGGLLYALIPILVGLVGVTGAMGIMYMLGSKIELSVFVLNVIPMVGLALSIDFALMIVSRFREELRRRTPEQALAVAMQTAGRAVVVSAMCVLLGLIGTLFIRMPMFTSIAAGAMIVLVISALLALTFVPAVLSLIASRIQTETGRQRLRSDRASFWRHLSDAVMRRPIRIILLAALLVVGCLLPLTHMNVAIPDAASLPANSTARQTAERFERLFAPANSTRAYVVAETKDGRDLKPADRMEALRLTNRLIKHSNVIRQVSPPYVQENRIVISFTLSGAASSHHVMDWVRETEKQLSANDGNLHFLVGGEAKYEQEVFDEIFDNIKYVLLFIFASNFIVLFIAFRSVLIPIKTILMNLLSLGASYGVLVWIFQEGRFGESTSIAIMIPVFIFGLAFGISMDYGMFLLSRIAEVYRGTRNNDLAVREGLALTSGIITSAAAIMIAVTAPFALAGVAGVKQLGIGIAAAVFIDATLVRMMLVPSFMKLLGKWNWWAP